MITKYISLLKVRKLGLMATKYLTETNDESLIQMRDYYLEMKVEAKRKLYKCQDKFIQPDSLVSWANFKVPDDVKSNLPNNMQHIFKNFPELNTKIFVVKADITTLEIDCIVNAANKSLLGGGGVDGAIHSAAGPELLKECATLGGCETGDAKITGGYKLPARFVIHTVGPTDKSPSKLAECYQNCLNLMRIKNLRTIAFPCIATGVYGYPNDQASQVALNTVRLWMEHDRAYMDVDKIIFCLFNEIDIQAYYQYLPLYFPK